MYRRNRQHLMQTNEKFEPDIPDVNIVSPSNHPVAPPILASPSQSSLPIQETQFETKQVHSTPNSAPYTTRFGRTVKPKVIVSM